MPLYSLKSFNSSLNVKNLESGICREKIEAIFRVSNCMMTLGMHTYASKEEISLTKYG